MRRTNDLVRSFLVVSAVVVLTGCESTTRHGLSAIGLSKKPLATALVIDGKPGAAVQALNPFPNYAALQRVMSDKLDRPVAVDQCFAFQAESGLKSGWYSVAIVTPTQYARLSESMACKVLAAPEDEQGRLVRSALLVVPLRSDVHDVAELRGKTVAFGQHDDARTHHAALRLLADAGLEPTDLALDGLPVPGSLRHMPSGRSVAQAVLAGSADAGFIDEAEWEALDEKSSADGDPGREELRIVARTVALPTRLVIASPRLDEATACQVQEFLVSVVATNPEVLEPLEGVSGYRAVGGEVVSVCAALAPGSDIPLPPEMQDVKEADDETTPTPEEGEAEPTSATT